jgi:hypothetical protein
MTEQSTVQVLESETPVCVPVAGATTLHLDFYVFTIRFPTAEEVPPVGAPLYRESQMAVMNAFGEGTEGDAFE